MRIIKPICHNLPASVIEPENLFVAVKRIERERDDLILNHLGLELLIGTRDMNDEHDRLKRSKRVNQRIKAYCVALSTELASDGWSPTLPIYFREMKTSGVERLKARLSLVDSIIYQATVNLILPQCSVLREAIEQSPRVNFTNPPKAEALLGANIRAIKGSFSYVCREKYYHHWKAYSLTKYGGEQSLHTGRRSALYFDVSAFFDGVNHQQLGDRLSRLGIDQGLIESLKIGLGVWQGDEEYSLSGVGLPQGYEASAILSELYLAPLDTALDSLNTQGYRTGRYVDDVFILTDSAATTAGGELGLRTGPLRSLSARLRGMGLHLNPSKIEYRHLKPWSPEMSEALKSEDDEAKKRVAHVLQELAQADRKRSSADETAQERALQTHEDKMMDLNELSSEEMISQSISLISSGRLPSDRRRDLLSAILSIGDQLVSQLKREQKTVLITPYYTFTKRIKGAAPTHVIRFIEQRSLILQLLELAEAEGHSSPAVEQRERSERLQRSETSRQVSQIKHALLKIDQLSGLEVATRYLRSPDLSVSAPLDGEGGEVIESVKDRAKRLSHLLKGIRYLIYEDKERGAPRSIAKQLTEIARLEETLVIKVTQLLDLFEHDETLINYLVSIVEAYPGSPTVRYSIYRHFAELNPWPKEVVFEEVYSKLCAIELSSPSTNSLLGLLEFAVRCGDKNTSENPIASLAERGIDLTNNEHIRAHHRWLYTKTP